MPTSDLDSLLDKAFDLGYQVCLSCEDGEYMALLEKGYSVPYSGYGDSPSEALTEALGHLS